jgi:hypothetical protein
MDHLLCAEDCFMIINNINLLLLPEESKPRWVFTDRNLNILKI